MRRGAKIGLVSAAIVVLVIAITGARTLRYGFSTHDPPTAVERWLARSARQWSVPADLRDAKNPLPLDSKVLAEGRAHWADHCAVCHGNDGKGATAIGGQLYPRAPDMTLEPSQSLSDGELFAIIENGIRLTGMPGWGDGTAQSGHGSWQLVHFIRSLPRLTPEEIAEMEALNPKTLAEWEEIRAGEELPSGEEAERVPPHGAVGHHH